MDTYIHTCMDHKPLIHSSQAFSKTDEPAFDLHNSTASIACFALSNLVLISGDAK